MPSPPVIPRNEDDGTTPQRAAAHFGDTVSGPLHSRSDHGPCVWFPGGMFTLPVWRVHPAHRGQIAAGHIFIELIRGNVGGVTGQLGDVPKVRGILISVVPPLMTRGRECRRQRR